MQLRNLQFIASRDKIDDATKQLVEVFRTTQCQPYEPYNSFPVVTSPEELEVALTASQLFLQALVSAREAIAPGPMPKLRPMHPLRCLHSRQRYEAALSLYGSEMWWAAQLFLVPAGSDMPRLLRKEIE